MNQGDPRSGVEFAVRDAMRRTVAGLPDVLDLTGKMHRRAGRIRRRRRLAATSAALTTVAALAVAGIWLPGWRSGPSGAATVQPADAPSTGATPAAPSTTFTPRGSTPPAEHTSIRATPPADPAATGPWGAPALDEQFSSSALDGQRWIPYSGASGSPETVWSPSAIHSGDGHVRLDVDRVSDVTPVARAGGIKFAGAGHRYGRWEIRWRMSAGFGVTGQFVLFGEGPGGISQLATLSPASRTLTIADLVRGRSQVVPLDGTRFHTLAVESTPQRIRWLLDGAVVSQHPGGAPSSPVIPALQALIQGPDCGHQPLPAGCDGPASFPQHLDVDRLRFWSYPG